MGILSEVDKKRLLSNRYVKKITNSHISFTAEFKVMAVEMNLKGSNPVDIFNESGIDSSLFNVELPKKSIFRWKKVYLKEGSKGLAAEKRGKKSTGRPAGRKFKSLEAELEYLEWRMSF